VSGSTLSNERDREISALYRAALERPATERAKTVDDIVRFRGLHE